MFKDVLNDIIEKNKISQKENIKKEKESKQKKEKEYTFFSNDEIFSVCYSKELYSLILEKGFNIIDYKKLLEIPEYSYDEAIEIYTASYNNWIFEIKNLDDVDIEEGIFAIYSIKNETTGEVITEYVDLGSRNTGDDKLERFLCQLNCNSRYEYLHKQFGIYMDIPEELKKYGYEVDDTYYNFDKMHKDGATLKIETLSNDISIYLRIFEAIYDDIHFVVTNDPRWNVNSSNRTLSTKRAYYVKDYNGDIEKLISIIKAFKEHMLGHIGFPLEDGFFFTDKDIALYADKLIKQIPYKDWNTYQFKKEFIDIYDCRGYTEDSLMPNKINGREIYSILRTWFNNAAQWSKGNIALELIFLFEYNTNIDKDNIILHIYGIQIDNRTGEFEFSSPEKKSEYEDDEYNRYLHEWNYAKLCVDDEFKGNKEEVISKMNEYLIDAANAFGIENCFGSDRTLRE